MLSVRRFRALPGRSHGGMIDTLHSKTGVPMDFVVEFWNYMKVRKKFWLLPIFTMAIILGGLLILSQGSPVAPFIYTVF